MIDGSDLDLIPDVLGISPSPKDGVLFLTYSLLVSQGLAVAKQCNSSFHRGRFLTFGEHLAL